MSIGSSTPDNTPMYTPPSLTPPTKGAPQDQGDSHVAQTKNLSGNASLQGAALQTTQKAREDDTKATGKDKTQTETVKTQTAAPPAQDNISKSGSGAPTQQLKGTSDKGNLENLKPDLPNLTAYNGTSSKESSNLPPTQQSLNNLGDKLGMSPKLTDQSPEEDVTDLSKVQPETKTHVEKGKKPETDTKEISKSTEGSPEKDSTKVEPETKTHVEKGQKPEADSQETSANKDEASPHKNDFDAGKKDDLSSKTSLQGGAIQSTQKPREDDMKATGKDQIQTGEDKVQQPKSQPAQPTQNQAQNVSAPKNASPTLTPPSPPPPQTAGSSGTSSNTITVTAGAEGSTAPSSRASFFLSGFGGAWAAIAQASLNAQRQNRNQMAVVTDQGMKLSKERTATMLTNFKNTLDAGMAEAKSINWQGIGSVISGSINVTMAGVGAGVGAFGAKPENFAAVTRIFEAGGQAGGAIGNYFGGTLPQVKQKILSTRANALANIGAQTLQSIDSAAQTLQSAMSSLMDANASLSAGLDRANTAMHQSFKGGLFSSSS